MMYSSIGGMPIQVSRIYEHLVYKFGKGQRPAYEVAHEMSWKEEQRKIEEMMGVG